jgi:hypothetical protein
METQLINIRGKSTAQGWDCVEQVPNILVCKVVFIACFVALAVHDQNLKSLILFVSTDFIMSGKTERTGCL